MKFRLRVLVAVAATAVLGVAGAVAAAVPASAINADICESANTGTCVLGAGVIGAGQVFQISSGGGGVFIQNCSGNGQITYGGNPYCEVHESGNSLCMNWFSGTNTVRASSCDGSNPNQHWWWSGQKFRNYGATVDGVNGVCIHAVAPPGTDLVLAPCSDGLTAWTWG